MTQRQNPRQEALTARQKDLEMYWETKPFNSLNYVTSLEVLDDASYYGKLRSIISDSRPPDDRWRQVAEYIAIHRGPDYPFVGLFLSNPALSTIMVKARPELIDKLSPPAQLTIVDNLLQEAYFESRQSGNEQKAEATAHTTIARLYTRKDLPAGVKERIDAANKAAAAAIYQEFLYKFAIEQVISKDPTTLRFDTQGHLLTEVTLTKEQYEMIIREIAKKTTLPYLSVDDPQSLLQTYLGEKKITTTTHCSIDVSKHDYLQQSFCLWLGDLNKSTLAYQQAHHLLNHSQVIPLQSEAEMHMRLASRVLEKISPNRPTPEEWETIQEQAAIEINKQVRVILQNAMIKAYDSSTNTINYSLLNKYLAEARKELYDKICHEALMKACKDNIRDFDTWMSKINNTDKKTQKEYYTSTTATGHDYFETNNQSGIAKWISATDNTAHNKVTGPGKQALRHIVRTCFIPGAHGSTIAARPSIQFKFRVPSIAPNKKKTVCACKKVGAF